MIIADIIQYLESIAPLSWQESYDNAGLLTGDKNASLTGIYVCLDSTEEVVMEAVRNNCNLIIAHHPIIFSGLKKLTGANYIERTVITAIKNNVAIYAVHTNLDNISTGVNAMIAQKLQLQKCSVLQPKKGYLKKLVTFVPDKLAETLRAALFEAGAGDIGNYSNCSFNVSGMGTYLPGAETNPYAGEKLKEHRESETRIEVIFPAWRETQIMQALLKSHPYEEVAYDIYSLDNAFGEVGAGLVGYTGKPVAAPEFLHFIKKQLVTDCIRHTALLPGKLISKVAVCGGAGAFLLPQAIRAGADIFITADFKYHQFFDAEGCIVIADTGHYESEQHTVELITTLIRQKFANFAAHIKSGINTNPVKYI